MSTFFGPSFIVYNAMSVFLAPQDGGRSAIKRIVPPTVGLVLIEGTVHCLCVSITGTSEKLTIIADNTFPQRLLFCSVMLPSLTPLTGTVTVHVACTLLLGKITVDPLVCDI